MTDTYLTRTEYEARHAALETRLIQIESRLETKTDANDKEHDLIRLETGLKLDKLTDKIDKQNDKIDALTVGMLRTQAQIWRYATGVVVAFLTGGGLTLALQAFHVFR